MTLPESQFDIVASLGSYGLTRRHLLKGTAAILLQGVVARSSRATTSAHEQPTHRKQTEAIPYSPEVLPPGIRSRFVDDVNGLRMHVLEAGFPVKNRPAV